MIHLTALHYKIKISALERLHSIKSYNEELMFNWNKEIDKIETMGTGEYPKKPFIEPFEFEDDDYDITDKKFRIRLKNIHIYKENESGVTELVTKDDIAYSIKESVDHIDNIFEKEKEKLGR
jgi:hypothetical protein